MLRNFTEKIDFKMGLLIAVGVLMLGVIVAMAYTISMNEQTERAQDNLTSENPPAAEAATVSDLTYTESESEERAESLDELAEEKPLFGGSLEKAIRADFNGLVGSKVLLNGQWVEAGETSEGAKLLEILDAKRIAVEIEGMRREVEIADAFGENNTALRGLDLQALADGTLRLNPAKQAELNAALEKIRSGIANERVELRFTEDDIVGAAAGGAVKIDLSAIKERVGDQAGIVIVDGQTFDLQDPTIDWSSITGSSIQVRIGGDANAPPTGGRRRGGRRGGGGGG